METSTATVVGVFHDRTRAEQALGELRQAGFQEANLGMASGPANPPADAAEPRNQTDWEQTEGAAGIGSLVGACLTGVVTGTLAGMLPGAVVGGLLGTMLGMGIPAEEASHYERQFQAGCTVLTVQAEGRENEVCTILRRCGATIGADTATS